MADFQKFQDSNSAGDDLGLDGRIQAALHDVPIPEGLAARLQAALVAGPARVQSTTQNATIPTRGHCKHRQRKHRQRKHRTSNARSLQADIFRRTAIVLALAGALAGFCNSGQSMATTAGTHLARSTCPSHFGAVGESESSRLGHVELELAVGHQQQLARVKLVGSCRCHLSARSSAARFIDWKPATAVALCC